MHTDRHRQCEIECVGEDEREGESQMYLWLRVYGKDDSVGDNIADKQ